MMTGGAVERTGLGQHKDHIAELCPLSYCDACLRLVWGYRASQRIAAFPYEHAQVPALQLGHCQNWQAITSAWEWHTLGP